MLAVLAPFTTAFALTVMGVGLVLRWLHRAQILDHPNERSSHDQPTPRGGGLGVIPAIIVAWGAFSGLYDWVLLAGAAALGLLSWIDDARGLSPLQRLVAQVAVCGIVVATTAFPLTSVPVWVLMPIAVLALVWFVNLYNFMDGIDGITGVESAAIALGIVVVEACGPHDTGLMPAALAILGGSLGFLVWNWHPAKIFMGDSGSVPLGLMLGGLLLVLAVQGQWAAALILPAYYGADATITLFRRIGAREKIWQAHRKHFYQRATRGTQYGPHNHAQVTKAILLANLALIGAAVIAVKMGAVLGLAVAAMIVAALLTVLSRWGQGAAP